MGPIVWFIVLLVITLVLTGLEYVAVYRLRPYRIDIDATASPFSGRSRFVQINAFHPKNYSAQGKTKIPWLYIVTAGRWITTLATAWFGYWAFFT
jgi:hypothetical protein